MKPETLLRAARLIKTGEAIELGRVLSADMPLFAGRQFNIHTKRTNGPLGANKRYSNEERWSPRWARSARSSTCSRTRASTAGSTTASRSRRRTRTGFAKLGVEKVGMLFTRGVLLDIAAEKGVAMLPASHEISVAEIQAALARAKLTLQPGDAVLFHTGWGQLWGTDNARYAGNSPGIGVAAAEWLARQDVMLVGGDTAPVEISPNPDPQLNLPVHQVLLVVNGIFLLENLKLDELAAQARRRVRAGAAAAEAAGRHRLDGRARRDPLGPRARTALRKPSRPLRPVGGRPTLARLTRYIRSLYITHGNHDRPCDQAWQRRAGGAERAGGRAAARLRAGATSRAPDRRPAALHAGVAVSAAVSVGAPGQPVERMAHGALRPAAALLQGHRELAGAARAAAAAMAALFPGAAATAGAAQCLTGVGWSRRRLRKLTLPRKRRDEIERELAGFLEDRYEGAWARGPAPAASRSAKRSRRRRLGKSWSSGDRRRGEVHAQRLKALWLPGLVVAIDGVSRCRGCRT